MINLFFFFRSIAVPIDGAYFGQGTGTVLLNGLECTGTETNIGFCNKNPLRDNKCSHSTDAGLMCLRKYYILGNYKLNHCITWLYINTFCWNISNCCLFVLNVFEHPSV